MRQCKAVQVGASVGCVKCGRCEQNDPEKLTAEDFEPVRRFYPRDGFLSRSEWQDIYNEDFDNE